MPKLIDTRKIINSSLPSFPDAEIQIADGLLAGDIQGLENVQDKIMQSIFMLKKMIVKWNFTEEDGTDTPITEENIMKLPIKDLEYLLRQTTMANDFLAQQGKV